MQAIALAAVEPVALGVGVGTEVGLAQPRGLRNHAFSVGHCLVKPGTAFPQLVIVGDAL
ncbi:hypothetical protein D3C84_1256860 [compost metagenome]